MAVYHWVIVTMFLASLATRSKAISTAYQLYGNMGSNAAARSKRQSHPASTVARFPEASTVASSGPDGEKDVVPEPIDYLTPPRPPDPLPVSEPPPGPLPSRLPDEDLDTKWRLGYDPSEILSPPADPFSLTSDSGYTTINNVVLRSDDIQTKDDFQSNIQRSTAAVPERSANEGFPFLGRSDKPGLPDFDFHSPFSDEQSIENDFNDFDSRPDSFDKLRSIKPKRNARYNPRRRISVYDENEYPNPREEDDEYTREGEYSNDGDPERDSKHDKKPGHVYTFVKTDKHGHYKWGVRQHGIA